MTVGELIAQLQSHPHGMQVYVWNEDYGEDEQVTRIQREDELPARPPASRAAVPQRITIYGER